MKQNKWFCKLITTFNFKRKKSSSQDCLFDSGLKLELWHFWYLDY